MVEYTGIPVMLSELCKTDGGGALENLASASAEGARRASVESLRQKDKASAFL
jgi:hypothetical protein